MQKHASTALREQVATYIRREGLLRPGDRVGVAVSGGADSTALLRLLLELRGELGLVLSVVHFNHRIRGADADADQQFVRALAVGCGLEFHLDSGSTPVYARENKLSLEAAARELRYGFFARLFASGVLDKIATGHTLDDQAETVLLRLLRGAWTKGMAGIRPKLCLHGQSSDPGHPERSERPAVRTRAPLCGAKVGIGHIVRPLLCVRRPQLESYLRGLHQDWREDATNRDPRFTRNRVRHQLLPLLERDYNPAIRQVLAEVAELAQAEQEYWDEELSRYNVAHTGRERGQMPELHLEIEGLRALPLGVQRRLVHHWLQQCGPGFGFEHVEQLRGLLHAAGGAEAELPAQFVARRAALCPAGSRGGAEIVVCHRDDATPCNFGHALAVPGEVQVPEIGAVFRATLVPAGEGNAGREQLLNPRALGATLYVRNWRPGDRFWPAHSKSARKVKELLQARHVSGPERARWPVVTTAAGELVWMRGFPVPEQHAAPPDAREAILIAEMPVAAQGAAE